MDKGHTSDPEGVCILVFHSDNTLCSGLGRAGGQASLVLRAKNLKS